MQRATSTAVNADTSRLEDAAKDIRGMLQRASIARSIEDLERLYGSRYFGSERASAEGSTVAARPRLASALARETYRLALRHFFLASPIHRCAGGSSRASANFIDCP
jgi:hypothetical protein